MATELYEESYKNKDHFSFGQNWSNFLRHVDVERIETAKNSLTTFLGEKNLQEKTFVDIGCGSGLFSLAAFKLGAKKVVSVDVDDFSLACADNLRGKEGTPDNWEIKKGSALDKTFLTSLGTFDIVYSWGVLHHTGNMYAALENITCLPAPQGKMFIALYNDNKKLLEGTSSFWVKAKRFYNQSNPFIKKIVESIYIAYYIVGLLMNHRNPFTYIRNYQSLRGMNYMTDIRDWLGGYPYEFASPQEIIRYFEKFGYQCSKINPARSIGCNEFLFTKNT